MNFHLGKPIFVMLLISISSGLVVAMRPRAPKADLRVWVFADPHYRTLRPLIPDFERQHNVKVSLELMSARSLSIRLGQLFMSNRNLDETPDLVEMEIGQIGKFFRPPVEDIGFLPLNERLMKSGWYDRMVKSRFAPWSKDGVIFGVPHDVHPCTITYRDDLFRQAGVDLPKAKTWPQFQEACVKFERYWKERGFRYRHALELPESSSDYLQVMLLQRGINAIDSFGNIQLEDRRVAQTLAFYAQLVAGPKKMTAQSSQGIGAFPKDINEGNLCAFITPDWRVSYIKRYGTDVIGLMRMMPMPVFDPTDAPTSTWGGTMMTITRTCKQPDLAWELIDYLYFSDAAFHSRQQTSDTLPPLRAMWNDNHYHLRDPFFGGQKAMELYVRLAPKIPARYVHPVTPIATLALNEAVFRAVEHVKHHGDEGLEEACARWLKQISEDLRKRMRQWRFD